MDLYTEKLVPAIAGPTLFHPKIRHFEPMTTAKMPPISGLEQLRIPASTEAMAILTYANNRNKWQSMISWKKNHPGMKLPRYNSKKPTINADFKEEYSSSSGKQNNWGGWSMEGRKVFNRLQKKIHDSRIKNFERHVEVDKECVARLYEKYKDMHSDMDPPSKKQKTEPLPSVTSKELERGKAFAAWLSNAISAAQTNAYQLSLEKDLPSSTYIYWLLDNGISNIGEYKRPSEDVVRAPRATTAAPLQNTPRGVRACMVGGAPACLCERHG
jgi:hypothetical protein